MAAHALARRRCKTALHSAHVIAFRALSDVERYHWRYANEPSFVINQRMRVSIKKALHAKKAGRRWEAVVGYTLGELVARLEETMPVGYSLADFHGGTLHIDHVVPRSTFDVTDAEQLRRCWALQNLQTLTAKDNMRKGTRSQSALSAGLNA